MKPSDREEGSSGRRRPFEREHRSRLGTGRANEKERVASEEVCGTKLVLQGTKLALRSTKLALHGTKLVLQGTKLALHGTKLALHGTKLVMLGLKLVLHGLKLVLHGTKLVLHGTKLVLHGLKLVLHGTKLALHAAASVAAIGLLRARDVYRHVRARPRRDREQRTAAGAATLVGVGRTGDPRWTTTTSHGVGPGRDASHGESFERLRRPARGGSVRPCRVPIAVACSASRVADADDEGARTGTAGSPVRIALAGHVGEALPRARVTDVIRHDRVAILPRIGKRPVIA